MTAEQDMLPVEQTDIDLVAAIWNHALNNSPFETAVTRAAQLIAAHRLAATKSADERVRVLRELLAEANEAMRTGSVTHDLLKRTSAALAEAGGRHD